jgi:SAM-dependent methyltransferase
MVCYLGHRLPGRDRAIARRYLAQSKVKKLHIGCGKNVLPGWLNMDALPLLPDVLYLDATRRFSFKDAAFDYIFSEHMIEHISYQHGLNMLAECRRVLQPSGKIRISTPDLNFLVNFIATTSLNEYNRRRQQRCDLIKAEQPVPAPQRGRPPVSDRLLCTRCAIVVAEEVQGRDYGLNALGNPGNVDL